MRGRRILTIGSAAIVALLGSGAVAAAGNGSHPATPRPAAHQTRAFFLGSSTIKVRGTGGATLHLSVSGDGVKGGTSSTARVTLSTGTADGVGETHTWMFALSKTGVAYSSKTHRGHITSKKKLGKFGVIRLTFTKTSQHTSKCDRGTPPNNVDTDISGRLSGIVFFNTHSHAWGSVGSRKHALHFKGHSHFTFEGSGCPLGFQPTPTCVKELSWYAPYATGYASFSGSAFTSGSKRSIVTVTNNVTLSKPTGASRTDVLVAKEPAPTLHSNSIDITTSGKAITGSASVGSATSSPDNFMCKKSGKSKKEKTKYYTGTWTSTDLTANFRVTGKVEPATGSGTYWVETY